RKKYLEGNGGYEDIIKDCTETIIAQVDGMKHLVDEFSKFARMPESEPAPNDMHAIIDEAASLYLSAHKDVTIIKEYDGTLPILSVDKEQMKRVFVNLFDNAVAAMDGKGRIWVRTAYDTEFGTARIEVADEGGGILPEEKEKLFQPYFSKKKSGTGLGLAIVNRIIADHGGYIRAEANEPVGAKFIFELPVRA
ncbi:MAG TPA: ATP-binding protein, partial [Nitrospirota bacterium]